MSRSSWLTPQLDRSDSPRTSKAPRGLRDATDQVTLVVGQDGALFGLGGATISNGLTSEHRVTVESGGMVVNAGGVSVAGGVNVTDTGLTVASGGMSVQQGGMQVTGGITVQAGSPS